MITAIIIIGVAFGWLSYETKWFTIRLPYGEALQSNSGGLEMESNNISLTEPKLDTPYWWQPVKDNMLLCQGCRIKCHKDKERWTGWKIPAKTIKAYGSTMHFEDGCNLLRASMLKDVAQSNKPRKPIIKTAPLPIFITMIEVGTHEETEKWTANDGKEYECKNTVRDYESEFHDCLVPGDWLKEHEHDKYPEPTIELSIDGELKASINGDYKKGLIADTLKPYTKTVRAGKKTLTILKGGHVENMGGGAYIAVNGEMKDGEYKYF